MYKKVLLVLFLSTGVLCTGCDLFKKKEVVSHPDPNGSINEKIAYHRSEIKKYEAAIKKEKNVSLMSLQKREMSEVRRANNKQVRYQRKIDENREAIRVLTTKKDS